MKRDVLLVSIISKIEQECYRVIPDLTVRNTLSVIIDTCFSKGETVFQVVSCCVMRIASLPCRRRLNCGEALVSLSK